MADKIEPVRVEVGIEDKTAKTLDAIDNRLEDLTDPVKVPVDADTARADRALADTGDKAKALERLSPEVPVTADVDQAERGIETVSDDAKALDRLDATVKVDVDTAELERASRVVRDTGDDLDRTGKKFGLSGQAVADLTGPLGDASTMASDFTGVFDGLGDIAGETAEKMGLSASAATTLGSAISALGVVVAAGVAAWSLYSKSQQEAKQNADELKKAQQDLAKGDATALIEKLSDRYGKLVEELRAAGISTKEFVDFVQQGKPIENFAERLESTGIAGKDAGLKIAGYRAVLAELRGIYTDNTAAVDEQTDAQAALASALGYTVDGSGELVDAQAQLKDLMDKVTAATQAQHDAMRASADATFALHDAESTWLDTLGALPDKLAEISKGSGTAEQKLRAQQKAVDDATLSAAAMADAQVRLADEQATATGKTLDQTAKMKTWNDKMIDAASNANGPLRQSILNYIATVNGIPPEKISEISADLDQGSVDTAKSALDGAAVDRDAEIAVTQTGATQAATQIDTAAKDRTTTIKVKADLTEWDKQTWGLGPAQPRSLPPDTTAPAGVGRAAGALYPVGPNRSSSPPVMVRTTAAPAITVNVTPTIGVLSRADEERLGRVVANALAAYYRVNPGARRLIGVG